MSGTSIAKTLLDSALSLGATAAFSIEKIPATYAIGFSLAEMVVNVLFGALTPAPVRAPVGVTSNELKGDLATLRRQLDDDIFQMFETDQLADMQVVEDAFQDAWNQTLYITANKSGDPNIDKILRKAWDANRAALSAEILTREDLLKVIKWIEAWDARAYQTLGLYMQTAGLYLNICKLNLMWEYDKVQQACAAKPGPYQAALLHYYQTDLPAYKTALKAYEAALAAAMSAPPSGLSAIPQHRGGPVITGPFSNPSPRSVGPRPVPPSLPKLPPQEWQDITTSVYCEKIATQVRKFIAYVDPLVSALEVKFAAYQADLVTGTGQVGTFDTGFGALAMTNPPYGVTGRPVSRAVADRQVAYEKAAVRAGLLHSIDPALGYFDSDKIKTMRKTVDHWKTVKANYPELNSAPKS